MVKVGDTVRLMGRVFDGLDLAGEVVQVDPPPCTYPIVVRTTRNTAHDGEVSRLMPCKENEVAIAD